MGSRTVCRRIRPWWAIGCAVLAGLQGCAKPAGDSEPVDVVAPLVVYSSRAEQLIQPVFARYEAETGVAVRYITDSEQPLIQKLLAEGKSTPADILLTVDAGNLWYAAQQGVLRAVDSAILERNIPAQYQDPENRWFGLSVRARTIVYDTRKVDPATLSSYAGLADPAWRGRLCLRTSSKVYNRSLVAMLIAQHGEARTEAVVRGWVDNLATDVFANDTKLMEAIIAGQCELGIVNSYYFGRLQHDQPDLPLALFWPSAATGGVHVNVSGAGITRYAKHPDAAQELLEWLAGESAQGFFAAVNLEYPANAAITPDPAVAAWGAFDSSPMPVSQAGELQATAVKLMDRAGYH